MDFSAKNSDVTKTKTQCAVLFVFNTTLSDSASTVDDAQGGLLSKLITSKNLESSPGSTLWITPGANSPSEHILLVQLGKPTATRSSTITPQTWGKACTALTAALTRRPIKDAAVFLDKITIENANDSAKILSKMLAEKAEVGSYRYATTKKEVKAPTLKKLSVISSSTAPSKKGLALGEALGKGINTARELGNLPGNICTPSYLANLAKEMGAKNTKLTTKILGEKQMEKLGMGSFLSVSKGSDEEGKLIIMEYNNGAKGNKPHVLVGKGITFDTGGISLKPGPAMDEMKFDMCGAASVFGTMAALTAMNAPVNVVAIVAAAENMPSGGASKPGDVVTTMAGLTVEILNTDAEGRLVLCDALTYAERYKPKSVVDIATLTGACVIALGAHASGLFSNNDKLANALLASGENTQDRAWRMPIWDEYKKSLDSNFADMANIGGREAGSITAACFLSRFTEKYPWAHLDIAGTAWFSGANKGASGRPVGLLVDYLLNN